MSKSTKDTATVASKKQLTEDEIRERIMNGEDPDLFDVDAPEVAGGKPVVGAGSKREDDIAQRILDGEITDVDNVDAGESVNKNYLVEKVRLASKTEKPVDPEEAEMVRKILNGELP